jgi:hypothetical protein
LLGLKASSTFSFHRDKKHQINSQMENLHEFTTRVVGAINYNLLSPIPSFSPLSVAKVNKKLMTTDVSIMLKSIKKDLEETTKRYKSSVEKV